jgi:hypothetical protein
MIVKFEEDESGNLILPIPKNICEELNLNPNDAMSWSDNGDGSFTIKKKVIETELIIVETISKFRLRYAVRVPVGRSDLAIQMVENETAIELGQKHLGETVGNSFTASRKLVSKYAIQDCEYLTEEMIERSITDYKA